MTIKMLQDEMFSALKNKNTFRKEVISGIIARVKRTAIDKGCRDNISEEMVNQELLKTKKMVQEMIDTCPTSRAETLANYKAEMEIVLEFCPSLITDEKEIENLIRNCGAFTGDKKCQGAVMKAIKGIGGVDMKIVSQVFRKMI